MTGFAIGAFALVALTLAFILRPLMREPRRGGAESLAADTAVLKDQLAELERDYATGAIAPQAYEQAKLELKRRLLEDTAVADSPASATPRMRSTVAAIAVALPAAAIGVYALLGSPEALAPVRQEAHIGPAEIEAMVARLAERLEQRPDDVQGWVMLGRSYKVLGRHAEAAQAYARIETFLARDAQAAGRVRRSDCACSRGRPARKASGAGGKGACPRAEYTPTQILAGAHAFQRADYAGAVRQWERALAKVAPDSEAAQSLKAHLAEAHARTGAQSADKPSIAAAARCCGYCQTCRDGRGEGCAVRYSIYLCTCRGWPARPARGASPPGQDLPLDFTLDDSMAMAPNLKLSRFSEVVVGARVSRSGNPTSRSGDLQGLSQPVKVGAPNVAVIIDTALP